SPTHVQPGLLARRRDGGARTGERRAHRGRARPARRSRAPPAPLKRTTGRGAPGWRGARCRPPLLLKPPIARGPFRRCPPAPLAARGVAMKPDCIGPRGAVRRALVIAAAAAPLGARLGTAFAQKRYDSGASDTEIKLGQTMPYSGPASAYGTIG